MAHGWISVCLLLISARATIQKSTPDSDHYTAAVVEYSPDTTKLNDGPWTLRTNTDAYVEFIERAAKKDADIIVFPEDGLTGLGGMSPSNMEHWSTIVPAPSQNYVPCTETSINVTETLKRLSCAARENKIYVAVNIAEKFLRCGKESCPPEDTDYHNTNAVFDRTGKIVARYRKVNLYMEAQFSKTESPEVVTFDTDFGVRFGTFICFDILFHEPSLNLTRDAKVTDIIYTTAWFSELPFLTAVQAQYGWSYGEDVNLLAAGYNNPKNGNTGSGIYLGRNGVGAAVMASSKRNELLVHKVLKKRRINDVATGTGTVLQTPPQETPPQENWKDGNLQLLQDNLKVMQISDVKEITLESLCDGNFCCQFDIKMQKVDQKVKYKIAAFSGVRLYGRDVKAGVTVCGLIQCVNDSLSSCGDVASSENIFSTIEISTKFDFYDNNLIMPSTLNSEMLPIEQFTMDQHKHDDHVHVSMSLKSPTKNLAAFAVYSRDFSRDGENSAATNYVSFWVLLTTFLLVIGSRFSG